MRSSVSRIMSLIMSTVLAVSLFAAMTYTHQAFATDGDGSTAPVSNITKTSGSLTIHKFTPAGTPLTTSDGTKIDTSDFANQGAYPIEGVKFTIKKINGIDLKTNDGWKAAADLAKKFEVNPSEATITGANSAYTLGTAKMQTTGANGDTDFTDLPLGLYFVQETNEPSDPVTIHSTSMTKTVASSLVPSAPFVVAIPMTNPTNHNEWMYDIHTYPKNSAVGIQKGIVDSATPGAGNTDDSVISYNVTADIPKSVKEVTNFQLIDPLDARLSFISDHKYADPDLEMKFVDANGATVAGQSLVKDTDYQVQVKKVDPAPTSTTADPKIGTYVTINFLKSGLDKLVVARDAKTTPATKVVWTLYTKLNQLTESATTIPNTAYLIPTLPNNPSDKWDGNNGPKPKHPGEPEEPGKPDIPGTPSNTVVSKYGKVVLTKKSAKDDSVLKDASFQLYRCNATKQFTDFSGNVLQKQSDGDYSQADLSKWAIKVNDMNKWTTGSDGTFSITGLQLNDFKNNASSYMAGKQSKAWKDDHFYCFREVQAPAGYALLPEPISFQITTDTPTSLAQVEVKDAPANGGFHLPVTGSQGVIVLLVLGSFLIAGSLIYTVLVAKKRREETTSL